MVDWTPPGFPMLRTLFWTTILFSPLPLFADEPAPTPSTPTVLIPRERLVVEHEITPAGDFVATDLLHGQDGDRLRIARTWGGPNGGDGHFGPGWYDSNVIQLTRETENQVIVTRGPFVWIVANRSGDNEFASQRGDVIRSNDADFVLTRESGTTFSFDNKGRLGHIEPKMGPAVDFSYSPKGELLEIRLSDRNTLRYVYEDDRVTAIKGPEGLRVDYVYELGRLVEVINGWRHRIRYEHGEGGTLLSAVDQYANVATVPPVPTYQSPLVPPTPDAPKEPAGQEKTAEQETSDATRSADDREQESIGLANVPPAPIEQFDDLGRLTHYEERGRTFEYEYDHAGRLKSEQAADGTTQWTYDEFGRQRTVRLPDGSRLTYSYNKLDQPVRIESSTGAWDAFEYDEHGNLILAADSDGRRTAYDYDSRGRLSSVQPSVGFGEQYTYDDNDTLTAIRYSNGQEMSLDYDADGRLVETAWSTGQRTLRKYGPEGRLLSKKVDGLETTYGYDEQGRLETITDSVHGEKRFDYSQEDRDGLLRLTWGGTTWSRQTNEWIDPVETALTAEDIERRSLFLYHPTGEVSDVSSPAGRFWSYLVDNAGRQIRIELPGGQGIDLQRDHAGRVTKVVRDGVEYRTWLYDASGRVQMEMSPKGIAAVYSRDKAGRVREVIEPNGKVQYLYDQRGLVTALGGDDYLIRQEHHPDGSLARRNYVTAGLDLRFPRDEAGRPAGILLNDIAVRYEYDEHSRVSSIVLPGDARIWILRDEAGRPTEITFGDHTHMGLTWDHRDRITSVGTSSGEENYLTFLEQYEYDAAGNLAHLQSLDQPAREMTYDADNRLTSVKSQFAATDFEYDDNDNLTVVETGGVRSRWELDSGGRPRDLGTRASYIWDEGGNLVSISDLDLQTVNSFDAAGRLVHRNIGDHYWSFGYLPSGDRLWQEGPKGRAWYAYLREGLTAIKDEDGTRWLIVNLPGTDRPLAMCGPAGATLFVVTDHLHSIRRVLDPAGQVLSSTEYGEFGQVADNAGSAPLAMYAGMVRDNHGLYYARRRYYDPALLRFVSIDPWTGTDGFPASHNAYAYAANNPLRYRDPSGMAPEDAGGPSSRLREYFDAMYPDQLSDEALEPEARRLLDSAAESRPVAPRVERGDLEPLENGGVSPSKRITERRIPASRHVPEHQRLIDELKIAERRLHGRKREYGRLANTPLNQRDIFIPFEEEVERARTALREYEENRFRGGGSTGAAPGGSGPGAGSGGSGGRGGRGPGSVGPTPRDTRPLPSAGHGGAAVPRDTRPLPTSGQGGAAVGRDTRPLPAGGGRTGAQAARDTQRLRSASGPARASSFAPASQRQASALSRMRNSARGAVTRASTVANRVRNSEMAAAGVRTLGSAARFARSALIASALWHAAFDTTDPQEIARMSINDLVSLPGAVVDAVNEAPYFAERVYRAGDEAVESLRNNQRREEAIREAQAKLLEIFTQRNGEFEVVPNVVETPGRDGAPGVFREVDVETPERNSPESRWLAGLIRENVNNNRPALAGIVRRSSERENPESGFLASIAKAKQELDERDRIAGEVFRARDKYERELREAIIELERAKRHPGAPSQDLADLKEAIEDLRTRTKGIQRMGNARQEALAKEIANAANLVCKQADKGKSVRGPTGPPADLDPHASGIGARLAAPSAPVAFDGSPLGATVGLDEAMIRAAEEKLTRFNSMLEATRLPVEGLKSSMQKVRRLRRKVDDESKPDKPTNDAGDVKEHLKSARDHLSRASALRDSYNGMEAQVKKAIQLRRSAWNRLVPWSRTQQAKALMQRAFSDAKRPPGLLHKYDRPAMTSFSEINREINKIWDAGSEDAEEVLRDADEAFDEAQNLLEQLSEGDKSDEKEAGDDEAKREDDVYARLDQLKHCLGLLKKKQNEGNSTPEVVSTDAFAALDPTYAFEKQVWTLTLIDKAEKPDDPLAPQGAAAPEEKLNPFEKQVWTLTLTDKDPEEKKAKPIVPIVPESTFRPNDFDIAARPNKEPAQPATKYPFDIARPQTHEPSQPATKTPGEIALDPDSKTPRRIPTQPATKKPPREIPSQIARSAPRLVTVPDVRGLSAQDAGKVISQATLGPSYALGAAAPRAPLQYQVYAQQPAPGARVLPGSGVRVVFFNKPSTQLVEPARRPTPTPAVATNQSVPKQPQVITQPGTKNNPTITRTPTQPATKKPGEITPRVSSNNTPTGSSNNRPVTPQVSSSTTPSRSTDNPTRPATPRVAGNSTPSSSSSTPPRKTTPQTPSSPATVMVPNVTGMSAAEASRKLRSANLQPKLKYGQDAPDKDNTYKVYSQSPAGGRQTAANSAVAVTIYGQFRETTSPTRSANTPTSPNTQRITSNNTPSGSSRKPTREVTPRSPSSPSMVAVPNVTGLSVTEAARKLKDANLKPQFKIGTDAPSKDKTHEVYTQSPAGGQRLAPDSAVAVTIYSEFRPREIPEDFGGATLSHDSGSPGWGDMSRFKGEWICISETLNGAKSSRFVGVKALMAGDNLTWTYRSGKQEQCKFRIDGSKNPKHYDWWRPNQAPRLRLYEFVDDNTLKWATNESSTSRPSSFKDARYVFICKRTDAKSSKSQQFDKAGVTVYNRTGETVRLDFEYRSNKSGSWKWYSTRTTVPAGYTGPLKDRSGETIAGSDVKLTATTASGRSVGSIEGSLLKDGRPYQADRMRMNDLNLTRRKEQ